jgi:hypothetical protein
VAVKAGGSLSETPLIKGCNDVAVDRFDQACRFLASLGFLFSLRGSSDEAITDEARRGLGLVWGRLGGTRLGAASSSCSLEGKILLLELGSPSHECAL